MQLGPSVLAVPQPQFWAFTGRDDGQQPEARSSLRVRRSADALIPSSRSDESSDDQRNCPDREVDEERRSAMRCVRRTILR